MTDSPANQNGKDTQAPLRLVVEFAERLDQGDVSYCHWKSNESLVSAVAGEHDLDLLIDRRDMPAVAAVLHDLGFRVARPTPDRQLPGILDYYGLDVDTGLIVHVHAHTQLVLGDDMTKNFRLPIEREYLASVVRDGVIPRPSAEFEYLVFVIRMVLKHCTWDAQLARKGKLAVSERREKAELEACADLAEVERLRASCLPMVSSGLFMACRRGIAPASRAARALTAQRLLSALKSLRRRGQVEDLSLRVWRRLRRGSSVVGRRGPGRKRLDHGGLLIGVVGGDGAGKSTAVEAVVEHLSKDFATRRIHMGKPPWSRASRLIRRPMRKARAAGAFQSTRLPPWADFDDIGFPGFGYLLWHTLIARDRFLEYRRARGAANDGAIVVSDRYPLDSIRLMDGRRIDRLPGIAGRPLAGLLRRVESSYYSRILPPDLVIVLRATPDVAAGRRLDDPEEFVRRRSTEVLEADWSGIASVVIDAGLPMDKVQAHVREAIWSTL